MALVAAALLAGNHAPPNADAGRASPEALVRAYPDFIVRVDATHVVRRDGVRMPRSDGVPKTPAERLAKPDIDGMFADPYVPGPPTMPPVPPADPGRVRYGPLFTYMYGDCSRGEVMRHLRPVAWMPSRGGGAVQITRVNGVADHLAAVVRDLEALPQAMMRDLVPSAGTYNCRAVAGSAERSMHAYGAAIDIAVVHADYWRWAGGENAHYRNRIPYPIVAAFERHGFIWGGKWSHFDTMHFEYRPELLPLP